MTMKVIIGGDFCITQEYKSEIVVSDEVTNYFSEADVRIVNLECPVTSNRIEKICKTGPHILGSDKCFEVLNKIGINVLTLANNHIMDYGAVGLSDTIHNCKRNNIKFTGAGKDKIEARVPLIIEKDRATLAILNFAENEWASADSQKPGANPYDVIATDRVGS